MRIKTKEYYLSHWITGDLRYKEKSFDLKLIIYTKLIKDEGNYTSFNNCIVTGSRVEGVMTTDRERRSGDFYKLNCRNMML